MDLIEVKYQEDLHSDPVIDYAFSLEEAQQAVLNFYREKLADSPINLPNYQALQEHLQSHSYPFSAVIEHMAVAEDKLTAEKTSTPKSTPEPTQLEEAIAFETFIQRLHKLLETNGYEIPFLILHELASDAMGLDPNHVLIPQFKTPPSPEEHPVSHKVDEKIWLVTVNDEETALFYHNVFIDAVKTQATKDLEDLQASAQMFAELSQLEIRHHVISHMRSPWQWHDVEKLLINSGILQDKKPNGLLALVHAKNIKAPYLQIEDFQILSENYQTYKNTGDESLTILELLVRDINENNNDSFLLEFTIADLTLAVPINAYHFVFQDIYATELIFCPEEDC